ncbi:MAG: hypothetical protein PHP44_08375 [Kiritimatiellae bacterium]|nr:hypothetical protein [Kiritimatiellia bacterium]
MKNVKRTVLIGVNLLLVAVACRAGVPEPSFRYYGLVRNEYGWPVTCEDDVTLELRVYGRLIHRAKACEREGTGVNFILEAPCESSGGETNYATYAVREGDAVMVTATAGKTVIPVMQAEAVPVVGRAGDSVRLNIQLGTDLDNDGLSDKWEMLIVNRHTNDNLLAIEDVHPGDDFDGDGATNLEEFQSGSSPVFEGDVFEVLEFMKTDTGFISLCFLTIKGTTYRLAATESLDAADWQPVAFRLSPGGAEMETYTETENVGRYFHVEPGPAMRMFRLEQL